MSTAIQRRAENTLCYSFPFPFAKEKSGSENLLKFECQIISFLDLDIKFKGSCLKEVLICLSRLRPKRSNTIEWGRG